MSNQIWRREIGRPAILKVPSNPDKLQATLEFVKWLPGPSPEVIAGFSMDLAEFQRAWDAGWMGMGPQSLSSGSEWFFDSTKPVEVTACLISPPAWTKDSSPKTILDRLEAALTDPSLMSEDVQLIHDISSWRYQSVVQKRGQGIKMGFENRSLRESRL